MAYFHCLTRIRMQTRTQIPVLCRYYGKVIQIWIWVSGNMFCMILCSHRVWNPNPSPNLNPSPAVEMNNKIQHLPKYLWVPTWLYIIFHIIFSNFLVIKKSWSQLPSLHQGANMLKTTLSLPIAILDLSGLLLFKVLHLGTVWQVIRSWSYRSAMVLYPLIDVLSKRKQFEHKGLTTVIYHTVVTVVTQGVHICSNYICKNQPDNIHALHTVKYMRIILYKHYAKLMVTIY